MSSTVTAKKHYYASIAILWIGISVLLLPWLNLKDFLRDHVCYWSGFQLFFQKNNPYDSNMLAAIQIEIMERRLVPQIPFGSPHGYILFAPIYLLPHEWSRIVWIFVDIFFLIGIGIIFLRILGLKHPSIQHVFAAICLMPHIGFTLLIGATGLGPCFGLFGGLLAFEQKKDWLAGLLLSFYFIRPGIFIPIFIIIVLRAIQKKRWKFFTALALYLAGCFGLLLIHNPLTLQYWAQLVLIPGLPNLYIHPTIASHIKRYIWENFHHLVIWPDAIMLFLGVSFTFIRYIRSSNFCWSKHLPWLICLSLIVAPYAATSDMIYLACPLLAFILHFEINKIMRFAVVIQAICLWMSLTLSPEAFFFLPIVFWVVLGKPLKRNAQTGSSE